MMRMLRGDWLFEVRVLGYDFRVEISVIHEIRDSGRRQSLIFRSSFQL